VDAVAALGITEARGTVFVLRAIKHNEFPIMKDYGGIKSTG